MNEHDAIQSRLRRLASAPVDEAVAQRHLSSLGSVDAAPASSLRRGRVVMMGAVMAGTLVGSATLAGAATGNLPGPAQDAAHVAFAKVGIDVPEAKAKGNGNARGKGSDKASKAVDEGGPGSVERFLGDATTPCTLPDSSAFVGNHGQYVAAHPDDPATAVNEREVAAQSPCGKPLDAVEDAEGADNGKKPASTGKPESPGKSEEHKPADAGKPVDAGTAPAGEVDDSTDDSTDDGTDDDGTADSGKGTSGKGRSGSSKATDPATED
ncbi:MAG: hypothetical protein M3394_03715 [Actinomycetota bacterium]|nr:hypothetical protein [Actinomycetota bacterium]